MIVGRMLAWLATAVTAMAVGAWLLVSLLVAGGPGVDVLQLLAPSSEILDELAEQSPAADGEEIAQAGEGADSDAVRDDDAEGADTSIEAGAGGEDDERPGAGGEEDAAGEGDGPGEEPEAGAESGAGEQDEVPAYPADEGSAADEDDVVGEGGAEEEPGDVVDAGLPPSVNWPDFAAYDELLTRRPAIQTTHFDLYAVDTTDPLLAASVARWAGQIETFHDYVTSRAGPLPEETVRVLFDRRYEARCPARGLASPGGDSPYLVVFVDESTTDEQVRAVLAHEIAHHVFGVEGFVGDGVLTEGLANWAAGDYALTWQGFDSWADAARRYMAEGSYVSVADEGALTPRDGEDCIARRDRIYNVRAAFVGWMVERHGLDLLRAMPVRSETRLNALSGERMEMDVPDYEAATGRTLTQLEAAWLRELMGGEALDEAEPDDASDQAGDTSDGGEGSAEDAAEAESMDAAAEDAP